MLAVGGLLLLLELCTPVVESARVLLDIPPRFMWGWGPGVSGYCGSCSLQTAGIYYGNWLTQDRVRGTTGAHDGAHEILLGNSTCCSAVAAALDLKLNVSQWDFGTALEPQHPAFLTWMKDAIDAGEPVVFGVYMQTETASTFDHIVPLVGYEIAQQDEAEKERGQQQGGDGMLGAMHIYFNDLHSHTTQRKNVSSFVSTRKDCAASLPWDKRFEYCLPSLVDYGYRVHGNLDTKQELVPTRLSVPSWDEPDYSVEDGRHEKPVVLSATVHVSNLVPGQSYALLRFNDPDTVPHHDFLHAAYAERTDFVATKATYVNDTEFWSNSTAFYRCVRTQQGHTRLTRSPSSPRTIFAWASAGSAVEAAAQLMNATWEGVIDGVQGQCGAAFFVSASGNEVGIRVNETTLAACQPVRDALRQTGGAFHAWIGGVPQEALESPSVAKAAVASAVAMAKTYGFDGYSIDDESDCAPRSTLQNFTAWINFMNLLGEGLHNEGLQLSAAVQAMFGIQDVPYAPRCAPASNAACSQACDKAPWEYDPNAKVVQLMSETKIDRWLEMDTYYFTTNRFLDALDWYAGALPSSKLGVSVMNRGDITPDGYIARFHALERSGADWLNIFLLPVADAWLPWVKRWKTRCQGCPNQGMLSCYEPSVDCGE